MPILYPGFITLLGAILLMVLAFRVGRLRSRHNIQAPAVTGHPEFERACRVHMNTIEQFVVFLPMLWLFAALLDGPWAGILGLVWLVGRVLYAVSYTQNPARRLPGMVVTLAATALLILGVAWGLLLLLIY